MGPYIRDEHYMYGSMHIQPYPAYYNSMWFRRKPPRRDLGSLCQFYDDGNMYVIDCVPGDPAEPVIRSEKFHSIINIETIANRSLRIKLYAMREEDDTDVILEIGCSYKITYITEGGLKVATGVLKIIDSAIPDKCTRYIGEFNQTTATAWIGMDCSRPGMSDKRKIYIAAIRAIEVVEPEDIGTTQADVDSETMTAAEKLNWLMRKIDYIIAKIADGKEEILARLDQMDPMEKLEYLISTLDEHVEENKAAHQIQINHMITTKDLEDYEDQYDPDPPYPPVPHTPEAPSDGE